MKGFKYELVTGLAVWLGTGFLCYFIMWLSYYI